MLSKKLIAILACVIVIFPMISIASATVQTATVWGSTDGNGSVTSYVVTGSTVTIYWDTTPASSTVNIHVTYSVDDVSSETLVAGATWTGLAVSQNGTISFEAANVGVYWIYCENSVARLLSFASIFSAPESVFGSIMAIGVGLAAFGAVGLVKLKKTKPLSSQKTF